VIERGSVVQRINNNNRKKSQNGTQLGEMSFRLMATDNVKCSCAADGVDK